MMLMITSFNENLLNQYGRRMVEEFSEKSGPSQTRMGNEGRSITFVAESGVAA